MVCTSLIYYKKTSSFKTFLQYSQLSRHIIKLHFIYSLALLQHSVVFWSLPVLSIYLIICFSILWKYLLNTLALFHFSFSILNCFWLLKYHHSLLILSEFWYIKIDLLIYRIVIIFRNLHFIFLGFSRDKCIV